VVAVVAIKETNNQSPHNYERKLERAGLRLEALEAEVRHWLNENSPTVQTKFDPQSGMNTVWVEGPIRKPPIHFGLIVGDCLHNLRSALDNLVYELAVKHNGAPLDDEIVLRPMFLIEEKREDFKNRKWRPKYITPEAQAIIEQMQPYNQTNVAIDRKHLRVLNELSNMDKHRVPHVALGIVPKGVSVIEPSDDYERDLKVFNWRMIDESMMMFQYPPAEGTDVVPSFGVGFGPEAPVGARQWPVDTILRWLLDAINGKVVPPLKQYLT
jgi:hypothetical protein